MSGTGSRGKRNILKRVPVKKRDSEQREPGLVSIIMPRFDSRAGKIFATAVGKGQSYRINLDAYGSEVWELIDGERDLLAIGGMLKERHGDEAEPVYERLSEFVQRLRAASAVEWKE